MASAHDNIMILGLAKTGSTGLYNNTKSALAASSRDYYCLFEPTRPDPLHNLCRYAPDMPVLTKVMIAREPSLDVPYAHFSKRVTLVRDPRDMIVSFLLFRPFIRADAPRQQVQPFVDAIREKEDDPASRSVQSLHALADTLGLATYRLERVAEYMRRQAELIDRHDMFTVRYEDFIVGHLDDLDAYLGFAVGNRTSTSPWLDHILRAAGSGDWQHWFTSDDVAFYRPYVERYMQRFEYGDDWQLAAQPSIDPATASAYIESKYGKRFAQQEQRRKKLSLDLSVPEQRARVEQLASDGDPQAMYRLATANLDHDDAGAFRLTYRAAIQGHRSAMRQLGQLYRDGRGVAADHDAAAFWADEARQDEHLDSTGHGLGGLRRAAGALVRTLRG